MEKDVIIALDFPDKKTVFDFLDIFEYENLMLRSAWNFFTEKGLI